MLYIAFYQNNRRKSFLTYTWYTTKYIWFTTIKLYRHLHKMCFYSCFDSVFLVTILNTF